MKLQTRSNYKLISPRDIRMHRQRLDRSHVDIKVRIVTILTVEADRHIIEYKILDSTSL